MRVIRRSTCTISEFAQWLSVGRNQKVGSHKVFVWLRQHNFVEASGDNYNLPTYKSYKYGLLCLKTDKWGRECKTTVMTPKGQAYFKEAMKGEVL